MTMVPAKFPLEHVDVLSAHALFERMRVNESLFLPA